MTTQNYTRDELCDVFTHPSDKKALDALKKIPFFDKVCSKIIAVLSEPFTKVYDMSSKVRITERQLPELHLMLTDICEKLKIDTPDFYLELNRSPNAYTYGDKRATVTVTSGLLECLSRDELYAVIAHECGHIATRHVLYTTMARLLLFGGTLGVDMILGNNFITAAVLAPIKLALAHWHRCSELSADRAAAVCCGNTTDIVCAMTKLAGGATGGAYQVDPLLFAEQAHDYKELLDEGKVNKLIEFSLIYNDSHPMPAVRANEILTFGTTDAFKPFITVGKKKEDKTETKPKKRRGFFGLFGGRK